jgi:hypothetical protein
MSTFSPVWRISTAPGVHAEDAQEIDEIRLDVAQARQEAQFLLGILQRADLGYLLANLWQDRPQIRARRSAMIEPGSLERRIVMQRGLLHGDLV